MSKECKWCSSTDHTQFYCYRKPNTPIKARGKIAKQWTNYRADWLKKNPEPYQCYLCEVQLDRTTVTLDHVLPRSGNPELRFTDSNIKPCCFTCNSVKGSSRLT